MVDHQTLGTNTFTANRKLVLLIRNKEIQLAGNKKLKIYGLLSCNAGKRMKISNRVFFKSLTEAVDLAYRPCGHCLRAEYKKWKYGSV